VTEQRRIDYARLIPELSEFCDSGPWAIEVWLANIGRYDAALAYLSIFGPEFTEVDDCVLLGPAVPDTYTDWKARHGNDPSAIEAVLNHRHLFDLFPVAPEPSREVVLQLGMALKEMWTAKLHRDFPARRCIVSFPADFDVEVDDPEITFCTIRDVQPG
jgi:hypothetical protein